MIKVSIAEIENLTDILKKAASASDEVLNKLRQLSNEMTDDFELAAYSGVDGVMTVLSEAITALSHGNDTLQSLKNVMLPVADLYKDNERKNKEYLNKIIGVMNVTGDRYSTAVSSDSILYVEHSEAGAYQNRMMGLISDYDEKLDGMRTTDIAAIAKIVKEDYKIKAVRTLNENE